MCDSCDKEARNLYEDWMKQEKITPGDMSGGKYHMGMLHIPDVGLLILQKQTDRAKINPEGVTELPDSPISSVFIHETEVEEFMRDIVFQMGPVFMLNMLQSSLKTMKDKDNDE